MAALRLRMLCFCLFVYGFLADSKNGVPAADVIRLLAKLCFEVIPLFFLLIFPEFYPVVYNLMVSLSSCFSAFLIILLAMPDL